MVDREASPGDKSISRRGHWPSAEGQRRFEDLAARTPHRCRQRAMGVTIEADGAGNMHIEGRGLRGLQAPAHALDLGNSGTGMRLLTGVLAGQAFASTVIGDESLMARPMRRIQQPLAQMGARVATTDDGTPPLNVTPAKALHGINYDMPVASAQVKSCLLLAGLYADGTTQVTEPGLVATTERMLAGLVIRWSATAPCELREDNRTGRPLLYPPMSPPPRFSW